MAKKRIDRTYPFQRSSGLLLHPTSLPSAFGIGDLGPAASDFIRFLSEAGQSLWQVCPLGPTGYGDSPYQCFSARAGNTNLISLELLIRDGLLCEEDVASVRRPVTAIDFGWISHVRRPILQKSFSRFKRDSSIRPLFLDFCTENASWLEPYVEFMVLKEVYGGAPWFEWREQHKYANPEALEVLRNDRENDLEFHRFLQFQFFTQWRELKAFAGENGISIIGDMPIFLSLDSVEAWRSPRIFRFSGDLVPEVVAGVPPDYFSATGQLWGNPVYDWKYLEQTGFDWWIDQLRFQLELYDMLRIDHFRGFSAYWAVPFGEKTAVHGRWVAAPGKKLFDAVFRQLGAIPVIAEDLGVITADVRKLIERAGFPGMKILQFAFDSSEENDYQPHTFDSRSVVYTGTHDNDTVVGWFAEANTADRKTAQEYLNSDGTEIHWDFIRAAFSSVSVMAIIPVQDVLGLDGTARMNRPGTSGNNWRWRLRPGGLTPSHARRLRRLSALYGRLRETRR